MFEISLFLSAPGDSGPVEYDDNPIIVAVPTVPEVGEAVWLVGVEHEPFIRDGKRYGSKTVESYVTGVTHQLDGGEYSVFVDVLTVKPEDFGTWLPRSKQWWR